ncbi:MAG: hypothetical protein ACR2QJ_06015 [Geminicoccaceae bacterium]
MPTALSVLASVTAVVLTTSSAGLATSPAAGALLIEGVLGGEALRIVVDTDGTEAEVTLGDNRHFLDLGTGKAHRIQADGTLKAATMAAREAGPRPEIQPWGPGPSIAGYSSVYHVIQVGGEICGELLISPWMKPFVDPAVEALSILERVKGEGGIKPTGLEGACGDLPFSSYALAGWPLMAGGIDQAIFKTETISFDYEPSGDERERLH